MKINGCVRAGLGSLLIAAFVLLASGCQQPTRPTATLAAAPAASGAWDAYVSEFLESHFAARPNHAVWAGRHEFDLVNSAFGYRARRSVEVKPGQIVALAVRPPNGSVSINALPWAEVWIDGTSVGQTPLGNLSVPLGEHEVVFRHPELGLVSLLKPQSGSQPGQPPQLLPPQPPPVPFEGMPKNTTNNDSGPS